MAKVKLPSGKEVELKNPKGRDTKKGFKLMMDMEHSKDDLQCFKKYNEFVEELTVQYSGFTNEELEDMDCDDMHQIYNYYEKKINARIDFLKSSLK